MRTVTVRRRLWLAVVLLGSLVLSGAASGHGTSWTRQFGTSDLDGAYGLAVHPNGVDAYVVGYTGGAFPGEANAGDFDAFLHRFNLDGNPLGVDQFGSVGDDIAEDVAVDETRIAVAGWAEAALPEEKSFGTFDAFVRTYDVDADPVWTDVFGTDTSDVATGVALTSDGILVTGATGGTLGTASAGQRDVFVRKYNNTGIPMWTTQFGTPQDDFGNSIAAVSDGVLVTGVTGGDLQGKGPHLGDWDVFVQKLDNAGDLEWTRQFGTEDRDAGLHVESTSQGIFVAGYAEGSLPGHVNAGLLDAFVAKLSSNGVLDWTQQFGADRLDRANALAPTDNGIFVAGETGRPGPGLLSPESGFLGKLDQNGNMVLYQEFNSGAESFDTARALRTIPGGVLLAGEVDGSLPGGQGSSGQNDAFLMNLQANVDGLIRKGAAGPFVGDEIHNTNGAAQTRKGRAVRGKSVTFQVEAQNNAASTDSLRISGCGGGGGFRVKYLKGTSGNQVISNKVTGDGYLIKDLEPDASRTIRLIISVKQGADIGAKKPCLVGINSELDGQTIDVVKAEVTVRRPPRSSKG